MALSNALVALAGALFAQTNGFADVTIGIGTIVVGLAAVIVGETLVPRRAVIAVDAGRLRPRLDPLPDRDRRLALKADFLGLQASDLNLVTALLVGGRADPAARAQAPEARLGAEAAHDRARRESARHLRPGHAAGKARALRGVDLAIPSGQFVTVIGSNGAGKSTLLERAGRRRVPDRGHDRHRRHRRHPLDRRRARAGCWPASSRTRMAGTCATLTIEENMALAAARGRARGLGLAVGSRQRAQLRRAARGAGPGAGEPAEGPDGPAVRRPASGGEPADGDAGADRKILLLDEHTAALDPAHRRVRARPDAPDRRASCA